MKIRVTTQFKVVGAEDLDAHTDKLFNALVSLERQNPVVSETDLSVTVGLRIVNISLVVEASSWATAETLASDFIERAIEATGGFLTDSSAALAKPERFGSLQASIQSTELIPA